MVEEGEGSQGSELEGVLGDWGFGRHSFQYEGWEAGRTVTGMEAG
jgi:hypothetical protein